MWIFCVVVIVVMIMAVVVIVMMFVLHRQSTHACAERIAQLAIRHIGPRRRRTLAFHVMVVAFLDRAHFALKT
jgi:flagellar basal body-associated protein FliL